MQKRLQDILSYTEIAKELNSRNIRPSYQRIRVLGYLLKKRGHPNVDEIYQDLLKEIPTLSKSTIYNTLNIFFEAGIVNMINIEDNEIRYDIITETHGHFKCSECGVIINFNVDVDSLNVDQLNGFRVVDKNVYFKGVCPQCLLNINITTEKENTL